MKEEQPIASHPLISSNLDNSNLTITSLSNDIDLSKFKISFYDYVNISSIDVPISGQSNFTNFIHSYKELEEFYERFFLTTNRKKISSRNINKFFSIGDQIHQDDRDYNRLTTILNSKWPNMINLSRDENYLTKLKINDTYINNLSIEKYGLYKKVRIFILYKNSCGKKEIQVVLLDHNHLAILSKSKENHIPNAKVHGRDEIAKKNYDKNKNKSCHSGIFSELRQ